MLHFTRSAVGCFGRIFWIAGLLGLLTLEPLLGKALGKLACGLGVTGLGNGKLLFKAGGLTWTLEDSLGVRLILLGVSILTSWTGLEYVSVSNFFFSSSDCTTTPPRTLK